MKDTYNYIILSFSKVGVLMNLRQFIKNYRPDWQQLEEQILAMNKGKKHLSNQEINSFHQTYLKVTQSLSYSQTYFPNEEVSLYLNELVAKAHNLLYRDTISSTSQFRHFFTRTFIKLLTEQWKFVLLAMILFLIGGIGGFFSVLADPLNLYTILPGEIANNVDPEFLGAADGMPGASAMSANIMTNNIQVAFLAFAGGISFGLLTGFVLVYNGIIIGALAALFWHSNMTYEFWAYIVPHGMIELTAIFIAGGAGLLMGYKLFVPGPYKRSYQLKEYAKRSVQLVLGTIPLFIIAGIIEGYVTPSTLSLEMKYFVAFVTVIGLIAYIIIGNLLMKRASE